MATIGDDGPVACGRMVDVAGEGGKSDERSVTLDVSDGAGAGGRLMFCKNET